MKKSFIYLCLALLSPLLTGAPSLFAQATSAWVFFGNDGLLHYQLDANGNRIMDYSYAGYKGGGIKLPDANLVPAVQTVNPTGGDDTSIIQAAINVVAQRTPDGNGFRGAVLLNPGTYNVAGTVAITSSGIVLRGSGSAGPNASIINLTAPAASPNTFLDIHGSGSYQTVGSSVAMTDSYIPSGAMSFNVSDASGFHVGDSVLITRPVTAAWVHFMGMDTLVRDGQPETWLAPGSTIRTDRTIAAINGNQITVDVPLTDSFDSTYLNPPGGSIARYSYPGRISQVGLEHMKIIAPAQDVDISFPQYQALTMDGVMDAWISDVFIQDTENTITLTTSTKQITFDNVTIAHSIPFTFSAGPVDFAISGTQVLINKCAVTTNPGVWAYATHSRTTGPVVLLNSSADARGFSPHQRWATGLLADSCQFPGGTSSTPGIAYSDRGTDGSGHGWDAGWAVAWNATSPDFLVQAPPGVDNWCIGCIGKEVSAIPPGGTTVLPNGIYDSLGTHVTPPSLYIEQLRERRGDAALANIGYADFSVAAMPGTLSTTAGGSASFTVNLTPQDVYTGKVKLSVSGLPAQATAAFTPATVNGGSGSSTLNITNAFPAGTYPLTITGAATNLNHSVPVILIVSKTQTATALTSSANPSGSTTPVTFTATVMPANAPGTVQFQDGNASLGSLVALSNGTASLTTSALIVGTHNITAVYTPTDPNFLASVSPAITQVVTTAGTGTSTTTQFTNLPALIYFHRRTPAVFTVQVTSSGSTPQGSVILMDGNTQFGPPLILVSGTASYTSPLRPGIHNIQAVYVGENDMNGSFDGSSSSIQTVNSSPRPKPR
ncbi:MAG TPA: Ig-like domain-containing protein [Terriglobales bacterium]|nr:Ig-like domain-containing protein [Terriglobales bacterium]